MGSGWLVVALISNRLESAAPFGLFVFSQYVYLSPLNINWLWTCPHVCRAGSQQPTVSFYTPANPFGWLLDAYMGWENYHVEHHDFPEVPMYLLPRLHQIAPEMYEPLKSFPVLEKRSWQALWSGEYF